MFVLELAKMKLLSTLRPERKPMLQHVPCILVMISATEVGEMAQEVGNLPQDFDPATWLEENRIDLTIVANEALKEVVYEALEKGQGEPPSNSGSRL
jgi:hypothetical protein